MQAQSKTCACASRSTRYKLAHVETASSFSESRWLVTANPAVAYRCVHIRGRVHTLIYTYTNVGVCADVQSAERRVVRALTSAHQPHGVSPFTVVLGSFHGHFENQTFLAPLQKCTPSVRSAIDAFFFMTNARKKNGKHALSLVE